MNHSRRAEEIRLKSELYTNNLSIADSDVEKAMRTIDGLILGGGTDGTSETAASIKAKYESNADTNVFTDAEKALLNSIQAGNYENVKADWNETNTSSDSFIQNKPTIPQSVTNVPLQHADGDVVLDFGNHVSTIQDGIYNYGKSVIPGNTLTVPAPSSANNGDWFSFKNHGTYDMTLIMPDNTFHGAPSTNIPGDGLVILEVVDGKYSVTGTGIAGGANTSKICIHTENATETRELDDLTKVLNKFPGRRIFFGETSIHANDPTGKWEIVFDKWCQAVLHGGHYIAFWGYGEHWGPEYEIRPGVYNKDRKTFKLDAAGRVAVKYLPKYSDQMYAAISGLEAQDVLETGYDYYKALYNLGFRNVRISYTWNRLQPTLGGAFDATYRDQLAAAIENARLAGMNRIAICNHTYGSHDNTQETAIVTGSTTQEQFNNLYTRMAADELFSQPFVEWDTMNEPHWVNYEAPITEPLLSGAQRWEEITSALDIHIKSLNGGEGVCNQIWYEGHHYAGVQDGDLHSSDSVINSFHDYKDRDNTGFGLSEFDTDEAGNFNDGFARDFHYDFYGPRLQEVVTAHPDALASIYESAADTNKFTNKEKKTLSELKRVYQDVLVIPEIKPFGGAKEEDFEFFVNKDDFITVSIFSRQITDLNGAPQIDGVGMTPLGTPHSLYNSNGITMFSYVAPESKKVRVYQEWTVNRDHMTVIRIISNINPTNPIIDVNIKNDYGTTATDTINAGENAFILWDMMATNIGDVTSPEVENYSFNDSDPNSGSVATGNFSSNEATVSPVYNTTASATNIATAAVALRRKTEIAGALQFLKSPNGTVYLLKVDDAGVVTTIPAP